MRRQLRRYRVHLFTLLVTLFAGEEVTWDAAGMDSWRAQTALGRQWTGMRGELVCARNNEEKVKPVFRLSGPQLSVTRAGTHLLLDVAVEIKDC